MCKASSRVLSTKRVLQKCVLMFTELMELHCVPGTVLGSGEGQMDKPVFAHKPVLDLVEEKGT